MQNQAMQEALDALLGVGPDTDTNWGDVSYIPVQWRERAFNIGLQRSAELTGRADPGLPPGSERRTAAAFLSAHAEFGALPEDHKGGLCAIVCKAAALHAAEAEE